MICKMVVVAKYENTKISVDKSVFHFKYNTIARQF